MQRHFVVAGLGAFLAVAAFNLPHPPLRLLLLATFVWVTLEALARGTNAKWGYLWGWLYPEPTQVTRLDRFVDGLVHRPIEAPVAEPKVRILDPWDASED